MNLAAVEQIAKAVLYEGYMLYPYRPSSVKNKQRWNFGVLYPQSYSVFQQDTDPCLSQTQCLTRGSILPAIEVKVRFLQMIARSIGRLKLPAAGLGAAGPQAFDFVERMEVDGRVFQSWQEAEEREISIRLQYGDSITPMLQQHEFAFPAERQLEPIRNAAGLVVGVIVRDKEKLSVLVETNATRCHEDVFKIKVRILNRTPFESPEAKSRDQALMCSLLSAHTVLGAVNCEFVSMLEPPDDLRELVAACQNIGTWPVLVGASGQRDTLLSSPIILYDYPQIAPESAGDLFDGTEIDEILSLRIMTLTENEKREMRESDDRARQILERTEALPAEQFMKLHGVIRSVQPQKKEAS